MLRFVFALAGLVSSSFGQSLPAFRWDQQLDDSGMNFLAGIGTDSQGNTYVAGTTYSTNAPPLFVRKLDPSGNVVYSIYYGGIGGDFATAMAVDSAGDVYVTGTNTSLDFPITQGVYSPTYGSCFLFKLNPDGSVAYSTYFPAGMTVPLAIAVDGSGSVYLAGATFGGLPVTPGAYQGQFPTLPPCFIGVCPSPAPVAFLTKFDPTAASLIYSTYIGVAQAGQFLALGSDGSAYVASSTVGAAVYTGDAHVAGASRLYRISAAGSSLLASVQSTVAIEAMAIGPDGTLYVAGASVDQFQPTAGAFQTGPGLSSTLPAQGGAYASAIVKMDPQLQTVLAATYFGLNYDSTLVFQGLAFDAEGNVYGGGYSGPEGLPTRTPFVEGFGPAAGTGFLSELSGDLSTLLFSSYLGNTQYFGVKSIAIGSSSNVIIGGTTGAYAQTELSVEHGFPAVFFPGPGNVVLNSLVLTAPPPLRIDAVENAASRIDGPISAGETIVVNGAGFGSDPQLTLNGAIVPAISINATQIVAVVSSNFAGAQAIVQVQSGGAASNAVKVPVALISPGLFSADGSGYGQGYILNQDGTLNTPSNPASPGDRITIYATGVGPASPVTKSHAVPDSKMNVFVDGFRADIVAATMGAVAGLPGSVSQIIVTVPNPASMVASNPNLKSFTFPSLVGVILQIAGGTSQNGLAISIAQ